LAADRKANRREALARQQEAVLHEEPE